MVSLRLGHPGLQRSFSKKQKPNLDRIGVEVSMKIAPIVP